MYANDHSKLTLANPFGVFYLFIISCETRCINAKTIGKLDCGPKCWWWKWWWWWWLHGRLGQENSGRVAKKNIATRYRERVKKGSETSA